MTTTVGADRRADLIERAAAVGALVSPHAGAHDRDGTLVAEAYEALRESGLLALGVPAELGGLGGTIADAAAVQRELGRHCGSTALASSMHQHVVAFNAWRYRRGMAGAEGMLRRVAGEGIVVVSTGGADFTHPRGEAVKVDGGYRVSGRKVFCSQSEVGSVIATMFAYDDPEQGRRVLNMALPFGEGVTVLGNWDTLGMRGTASNDVVIEDVFVPDERVSANRPHGVVDPALQVIVAIAIPIICGAYLGVAQSAFDAAVTAAAGRATDPSVQRQVGLMANRLQVATWALDGALAAVGDDPQPSDANAVAAQAAKREVALAGLEVCDLAMEVAGGQAYFKGSPIERAYRDMRAIKFHPFPLEKALLHAGRVTLGQPADVL